MGFTLLALLVVIVIFLYTCLTAGRALFSGNFLGALGISFLAFLGLALPIYYLFFYRP